MTNPGDRLPGNWAVILGGSSGFGLATARRAAPPLRRRRKKKPRLEAADTSEALADRTWR
ncbi:MAG: hypothetical protein NEA02_07645 [Thermoanaerobaculia bacterium]|nr:hypothetical protein [Thermoanaerobaculia bacterium]